MNEAAFLQSVFICIRASEPLIWIESNDDAWIVSAIKTYPAFKNFLIQVVDKPDFDALRNFNGRAVYIWNCVSTHALEMFQDQICYISKQIKSSVSFVIVCQPEMTRPELLSSIPALQAPLPDFAARKSLIKSSLPASCQHLDFDRLAFASAGLQRTQIYRILARSVVEAADSPAFNEWENRIISEKKRILAKDMSIEVVDDNASLDDVGGADELKIWLKQREAVFGDEARQFGLLPPKGVLLVGIQGCGKSLIAKSIANAWHFPLLKLDMSSIFAVSQESPDAVLHRALKVADAMSPAVIWCDEIEKAFAAGADSTTRRLLGHILNWLQERSGNSFFVATANDVRELPSELIRKGRFDELFFIDLPDENARTEIFRIHLKKRHRDPNLFDCRKLAELAQNFSGAEIEQAVVSALFTAFDAHREICQGDICDAIHDTVPLFKQREEDIKQLREWATERTRQAANNARLLSFFNTI